MCDTLSVPSTSWRMSGPNARPRLPGHTAPATAALAHVTTRRAHSVSRPSPGRWSRPGRPARRRLFARG
jgi:hypothetical protein